ncbi:exodeoxyribonuclease VII small subunit [Cupriavidus sp. DF5525]|uniref:exodeoxyribonuclease VII small subunit n=1 Tax=Cupriavidus sp. DF5525 TaxID=3160989 RepID=UPI0032E02E44
MTEFKSFKQAYGVLQKNAQTLREQTEPNIDDLLPIVNDSVAAYKVCKERLDAVELALKAALTDLGGDTNGRGADGQDDSYAQSGFRQDATEVPPLSSYEDMEEGDIPF